MLGQPCWVDRVGRAVLGRPCCIGSVGSASSDRQRWSPLVSPQRSIKLPVLNCQYWIGSIELAVLTWPRWFDRVTSAVSTPAALIDRPTSHRSLCLLSCPFHPSARSERTRPRDSGWPLRSRRMHCRKEKSPTGNADRASRCSHLSKEMRNAWRLGKGFIPPRRRRPSRSLHHHRSPPCHRRG